MTADLAIDLALLLVGFTLAAAIHRVIIPRLRERRLRARALADVEARVAELDALPPPDELPRARDLTPAEVRAQRGRRHPIARKRRNGRWG